MVVSEHEGERKMMEDSVGKRKYNVERLDRTFDLMVKKQLVHGGKVLNFPMLNSTLLLLTSINFIDHKKNL